MALPRKTVAKLSREAYRTFWSEIMSEDTVYLITWNPKPRFYNYDLHGNNDYEAQWRTMLDKLLTVNRCSSKYAFVAEISDQGKLHMHGSMVIRDKVKYHKSFLPTLRNNGFVKISKATSHSWKTFKYHVKDLFATADYIKDNPIVITSDNRDDVLRELNLYKSLIAYHYDVKQIKKRNVMEMLMDEESE